MMPHTLPVREHTATVGELVVLNGRQSGARRPLTVPVMFVGRAQGCDVRLNVEGIEAFHCVLASRPGEVTVRDLQSAQGTFVNGQRISAALLRDGDLLDVGPYRFRVLLPATPPAVQSAAVRPDPQREATRIQAAAVAAQQAQLDETETRLQHQAAELAAEAERLHAERAAWERQCAGERAALQRERSEIEAERQRTSTDMQPVREQLMAEERRLARLAALLDQRKAELQYQDGDLTLQQVRLNTQREVDSHILQDGMRSLAEDQQRWRQRRTRESLALRVRQVLVMEGERKLAEIRVQLVREQEAWAAQRHALEAELQGLNNRIVHQRQIVQEQEARRDLVVATGAELPRDAAPVAAVLDLDRLTGELADQRAHLMEQWERLVRLQDDWQARRDEAAEALATLGQRLVEHEAVLKQRAEDVETIEARLRLRQEHLERMRRQAALALARAQADRQVWEAERDEMQAASARLTDQAQRQLAALTLLRRKWARRRQQETEALHRDRQTIEQQRVALTQARREVAEQAELLETARRTLAEEALALEDGTAEAIHPGPGFSNRHQEPLRRRWIEQNAALVRALRRQREGLKHELTALRALGDELAARSAEVAQARAETGEQQTALEHREALLVAGQSALAEERRQIEQRQAQSERRVAALQAETEQLARALIPDTELLPEPLERAA